MDEHSDYCFFLQPTAAYRDSHPQPGFIYVKLHEMLARYLI